MYDMYERDVYETKLQSNYSTFQRYWWEQTYKQLAVNFTDYAMFEDVEYASKQNLKKIKDLESEVRILRDEILNKQEQLSKELAKSTRFLAETVEQNTEVIRSTVIEASETLERQIENVSDQLYVGNRIQEYYILQHEIDRYIDELIEMNVTEDFYTTVKLKKVQPISITQKEIAYVYAIAKNQMKKLEQITKYRHENPIDILANLIMENGINTRVNMFGGTKINNTEFVLSYITQLTDLRGYVKYKRLPQDGTELQFGNSKESYKLYKFSHVLQIKDKVVATNIIYQFAQAEISNWLLYTEGKSQFDYNAKEILEFRDTIESLNKDIELLNLRFLYAQLKDTLRKDKLEKLTRGACNN